jgi:hypothetical protein
MHHARSSSVNARIVIGFPLLFGTILLFLTTEIACVVACPLLPVFPSPIIVLYFQHFSSSTFVQLHSAWLDAIQMNPFSRFVC